MFKDREQANAFVAHLEVLIKAINISREEPFINEIKKTLVDHICVLNDIKPAAPTPAAVIEEKYPTLLCPDCGGEMALRTNRTSGNKFWGCKKYPKCMGTRDESGLSKQEREAKRVNLPNTMEAIKQDPSFTFNRNARIVSPGQDHVDVVKPTFNPFAK